MTAITICNRASSCEHDDAVSELPARENELHRPEDQARRQPDIASPQPIGLNGRIAEAKPFRHLALR